MMSMHKKLGLAGLFAAASLLTVGCKPEEEEEQGFPQPDNTIVLNFTIDASGRPGFYEEGDLEWKGAFTYDEETRILTYAADWAGGNGPYAKVYDDGPWTSGGHEPKGSTAGDDKFGIAAFIAKPEATLEIGYGAQTCCGSTGGWIWVGENGLLVVAPTDTEKTAEPLVLSPEGAVDLKLTLAANALGSGFTETTPIKVKGTFNDWPSAGENAYDDGTHGDVAAGDHIYTYTLSLNDPKRLKLTTGTRAEWVWLINGVEYKTSGGSAEQTGVKAFTNKSNAGWVEQTVKMTGGEFDNTYIDVP